MVVNLRWLWPSVASFWPKEWDASGLSLVTVLFVMALEPFFNKIRANSDIRGLEGRGHRHRVAAHNYLPLLRKIKAETVLFLVREEPAFKDE